MTGDQWEESMALVESVRATFAPAAAKAGGHDRELTAFRKTAAALRSALQTGTGAEIKRTHAAFNKAFDAYIAQLRA